MGDNLAEKIQEGLLDVPGEPVIEKVEGDEMTIFFPSIQSHAYVNLVTQEVKSQAPAAKKKIEDIINAPDMEDEPVRYTPPPPKTPAPSMTGFRKATRKAAKLRLGIAGPSGCGKTMSSLLVAFGICEDWGKIGVIDTENGSGELYVGAHVTESSMTIGDYNVLTLSPPYTPEKYIEAIKLAEAAGLEVVIIDSMTHAWAGEGGMLDQHGKIADSGKSNSWTAWRKVTPKHNALIEKILNSPIHVILTVRSKMDHIQTEEGGRKVIKPVGMNPIFRDGLEYEVTTFFEMDINHNAVATKDRSNMFKTDEYFVPSPNTGRKMRGWLEAV